MSAWANSLVLDGGLDYLKANADAILLIKNYSAGDNYATVTGNILAAATTNSGEYTHAGAAGAARTLTSASKNVTASASSVGGDDLHIAFTNGTDTVLFVTNETSNQVVTSGNSVTIPAITYTSNQPTNA